MMACALDGASQCSLQAACLHCNPPHVMWFKKDLGGFGACPGAHVGQEHGASVTAELWFHRCQTEEIQTKEILP